MIRIRGRSILPPRLGRQAMTTHQPRNRILTTAVAERHESTMNTRTAVALLIAIRMNPLDLLHQLAMMLRPFTFGAGEPRIEAAT